MSFKFFFTFSNLYIYTNLILSSIYVCAKSIFTYSFIGAIIGWFGFQSTKFFVRYKIWCYFRDVFDLIYLFCNFIEFWIELFEEKFIYIFILFYIYGIKNFVDKSNWLLYLLYFIIFLCKITYIFVQKIYFNILIAIVLFWYELLYSKIPIILNILSFSVFLVCLFFLLLLLYSKFFRQYLYLSISHFFYLLFLIRWSFITKIHNLLYLILKYIYAFMWVFIYHFFIFYFAKIIFFSSYFFFQLFFILILSWFILIWLFRHFVVTYDTSWMWYDYRRNRKRLIYPLKLILIFYAKLYYKGLMLVILIVNYYSIQFFFRFFFLYRINIFNFFLLYKFSFIMYVLGFLISCFYSIGYWKKVGFYIFNYRRIMDYVHWLGELLLGVDKKEFYFDWFEIILGYIQFWRYSKLERRRWFLQCYCFDVEDFLAIALYFYFKRQLIKITRSTYYYYVVGNCILKKLNDLIHLNFRHLFLKYSFINIRYMRILLLIYVRNYSFLQSFMLFSFKLHFYSLVFIFKIQRKYYITVK